MLTGIPSSKIPAGVALEFPHEISQPTATVILLQIWPENSLKIPLEIHVEIHLEI